ncbi:MAG TPA: hypothetical protein VMT19_12370 [Thermoanaerobaculaceae bacterium]|nr:hypothetical protein [Thermoanaerobaculaceae bacterium]
MSRKRFVMCTLVLAAALVPLRVAAQQGPDTSMALAAQRQAMLALGFLDGVWRGTAWTLLPSGEKHTIAQTERIGAFLDGSVKVIEGRGYETDGRTGFNALGIISYNPEKHVYTMRSYAQGNVGDFAFAPTAQGFVSELKVGNVTVRYTATVKGPSFHEVGDRITQGIEPVRIFEMDLTRVGDTDWPAAGAVPPK